MTALLDEPRIAYAARKVQRLRQDVEEWHGQRGVLEDLVRDANRVAQDLFAFDKLAAEMYTSPSYPASRLLAVVRLHASNVTEWASNATAILDTIMTSGGAYAAAFPGVDELRSNLDAAKQIVAKPPTERLFRELVRVWEEDNRFISSTTQIVEHSAFQRIVELGDAVVPLLLAEVRRRPSHLIIALKRITGHDPTREEDRGKLRAMADSWLKWGEERKLI